MTTKRIICCDKVKLANAKITDEGFIKGEAVVTRPGIFKYITADGKVSRRLRLPEEVTKPEHLDSMKMMPITNGHPQERWVDVSNARDTMIGQTGENVRAKDNYPIVPISIVDQAAIEDVKAKRLTELSLGYTAELDFTSGTYKGEHYDCIQRNMKCNHLALVKHGRANASNSGEFAQVNLSDSIFTDSDDAMLDDANIGNVSVDFNCLNNEKGGNNTMMKVNLDSIQYDAAPEVAKALEKANAAIEEKKKCIEDAQVAYKNLQTDHETLQGKHDALADELKKAKAANDNIDVVSLAKARLKIVDQARAILSKEEVKTIDDMSDIDIKKAVIKAMSSDVSLDEASETYINGRYDACIDLQPDPKTMANQRTIVNNITTTQTDENDARSKLIKRMHNGGQLRKEGGK
jgi:hypothetical protein